MFCCCCLLTDVLFRKSPMQNSMFIHLHSKSKGLEQMTHLHISLLPPSSGSDDVCAEA